MCVSGNKHEHRGETCVSVCDRDRKWKGERVTCHHRRGIQHAIMVILVTIWALQKVSDRVSAITRVRLQGEVERERRGQPAISLRSPVSPSQWILKASLFQEKSWLPWFLFSLYLFQTCNVKGIKKRKEKKPITPFCSQFYSIHSLSINVYSPRIHQGPLSKCYHKELWCLLHTQLCILLTSSSSLPLFLADLFQVSHLKLWLLLFTLAP